jgi:hypothetical protein
MKTAQITRLAAVALLATTGGAIYFTSRSRPAAPPPPAASKDVTAPIATPSAPLSADARPAPPLTLDELKTKLAALSGRPIDEVLARLEALRLPPIPRHMLERLLARGGSAEQFATRLVENWLEFQADRMLAWAVTEKLPPAEVAALLTGADRATKRSTAEDYLPPDALVAMLKEHFRNDAKALETLVAMEQRQMHSDRWAKARILEAATPEDRANAIRQLAWRWSHNQVADSVAWARANLTGEEFARFMASDFTSAQVATFAPDLALSIVEEMRGTENYALWASSAAFGLVRHQRFDEARTLLESVEGPRRAFALHVMGRYWTIQDAAGAVEWANSLPPADFAPALEGMYSRLPASAKAATTQQILAQPADPALDLALAEGLRRSAGGLDVASAADLLPQMLAQRGYGALDPAWAASDDSGQPRDPLRSKLWQSAATATHTLASKQSPAAARAWLDTLTFTTSEAALHLRALTLPEPTAMSASQAAEWVAQQINDPQNRAALETRLAQMRAKP